MSKPKILVSLLSSTERTGWINPELVSMLLRMSHDARFAVAVVNVKDARPFEVHAITQSNLRVTIRSMACLFRQRQLYASRHSAGCYCGWSPQQSVIGLTCGIPKRPGYCLYPPREHVTTTEGHSRKWSPLVAGYSWSTGKCGRKFLPARGSVGSTERTWKHWTRAAASDGMTYSAI